MVDRLARSLVDAALELFRRRLWRELPGDALFLVHVPTEVAPLAGNVMGQAGEEFGLALFRGPNAYHHMAALILDEGPGPPGEGDLLSLSFEPWRAVPPEFRRLLTAAGLQARRERMVPLALARAPFQNVRQAGRDDLRALTWVVRGVLAAHDAGELRPTRLTGRGRAKNVLLLEVGGRPERPTVSARLVPRPEPASRSGPTLFALPPDLRELPRLRQRWLCPLLPMPAEIQGDVRQVSGVFLADEEGRPLNHGLALGEDLEPVKATLIEAFRGRGKARAPRGLPRTIVFDSSRLQAAFAPGLAALGIEAVCDPGDPALRELVQDLLSSPMFAPAPDEPADPIDPIDPIDPWKAADLRVASTLSERIAESGGGSSRAVQRYFGQESDAQAVLFHLPRLSPHAAFVEWLAADYRATKRSRTLVEKLLAGKGLDLEDRVLFAARRDALLSVFRVDSCEPASALELEDVLTGERYTVHDRSLALASPEGLFLPLRLLRVREWIFPAIAGPPLLGSHVDPALAALEHLGAELTPAGLRRDAHLLGRLWAWFLERGQHPPVFQTTDGEPLELLTATFHVADPGALARSLAGRPDLHFDEEEGAWVWLRPADSPGGAETVLGRLEILDDRLVLETASRARLDRARAWLEELSGVRFERSTGRSPDDTDRPLDDTLPPPPSPPPPPEVLATLERLTHQHYLRWLDEPVPQLDDLTPRQACATRAGRRRVARLVRSIPPVSTPNGSIEPPREELLRELGIGPEG